MPDPKEQKVNEEKEILEEYYRNGDAEGCLAHIIEVFPYEGKDAGLSPIHTANSEFLTDLAASDDPRKVQFYKDLLKIHAGMRASLIFDVGEKYEDIREGIRLGEIRGTEMIGAEEELADKTAKAFANYSTDAGKELDRMKSVFTALTRVYAQDDVLPEGRSGELSNYAREVYDGAIRSEKRYNPERMGDYSYFININSPYVSTASSKERVWNTGSDDLVVDEASPDGYGFKRIPGIFSHIRELGDDELEAFRSELEQDKKHVSALADAGREWAEQAGGLLEELEAGASDEAKNTDAYLALKEQLSLNSAIGSRDARYRKNGASFSVKNVSPWVLRDSIALLKQAAEQYPDAPMRQKILKAAEEAEQKAEKVLSEGAERVFEKNEQSPNVRAEIIDKDLTRVNAEIERRTLLKDRSAGDEMRREQDQVRRLTAMQDQISRFKSQVKNALLFTAGAGQALLNDKKKRGLPLTDRPDHSEYFDLTDSAELLSQMETDNMTPMEIIRRLKEAKANSDQYVKTHAGLSNITKGLSSEGRERIRNARRFSSELDRQIKALEPLAEETEKLLNEKDTIGSRYAALEEEKRACRRRAAELRQEILTGKKPEKQQEGREEPAEEAGQPDENLQATNYRGALISSDMANALQNLPVGEELLRFEAKGKDAVVQIRLPEKGRYMPREGQPSAPELEGMEFNIRVNMNYLCRGMARACMDENGDLDFRKVSDLADLADTLLEGSDEERKAAFDQFVDLMDVPEGKRQEFENFLKANGVCTGDNHSLLLHEDTSPISMMFREVKGHLLGYQDASEGKLGTEARNFAKKYRDQFENTMQSYREMAEMDPEKETRILYPMDCFAFRHLTNHFVRENNAYRRAHGLPEYRVEPADVVMTDQENEAKRQNKELMFYKHTYLTTDAELDLPAPNGGKEKKNYTLSLESTAPKYGDLLHRHDVVPTGVGVFRNKDAVREYHRGQNIQPVRNQDTYTKIMNHRPVKRGMPLPKVKMPAEKSYQNYFRLHTGNSVNSVPAEKLQEYAVKAGAAAFLNRKSGAKGFSLDTVREYAEKLQKDPNVKAALRAAGPEKLREVLRSGDISKLTDLIVGGKDRYAVRREDVRQFSQLADSMKTEKRSPEWKALKDALGNEGMENSARVFDAVEKFMKGRKKAPKGKEERKEFDLALSAVAIAARSGDDTAKERAQGLVDSINHARGVAPGDPNYVYLSDYPNISPKTFGDGPIEFDEVLLDHPDPSKPQNNGGSREDREETREEGTNRIGDIILQSPIETGDVLM